jgi:anti-sigma regulatory factor (Ser/Thr protein kinase)
MLGLGLQISAEGYEADVSDVDLHLAGDLTAASEARRSLAAVKGLLDEATFDDVRLLVTELVTNSVRHADLADGEGIRLRVTTNGRVVRVEVADRGRGFEPKDRDAPLTQASGWGLYLVDKLADRWGVEGNNGTCVWFEIDARTNRN